MLLKKNFTAVNISFLSSLNILLRPDTYKLNIDDHIRNLNLLENFIEHKIHRNAYQIDKIKNTKKVQAVNKELINNLSSGKITHELIQCIVNIFEINLLVFDLTKPDIYFYWTRGHKYPFVNLFKNLYCMTYVQGNYEPIIMVSKVVPVEQIRKMYICVLINSPEIKCLPEINLTIQNLLVINTWKVPSDAYIRIVEIFFNKKPKSIDELYADFIAHDKITNKLKR